MYLFGVVINTIMAKIDEIETNYMPSYIKVGDYDY